MGSIHKFLLGREEELTTMHKKDIKLYICLLSLLMIVFCLPGVCYAHGDPMVVYVLFSSAIIHIAIILYFLFATRFKRKRILVVLIYATSVIPTWLWTWSYRGPEMVAYIGLFGLPLITCLCLIKLCPAMSCPTVRDSGK